MKSVVTDDTEKCFICGRYGGLEKHHLFGGSSRKLSEKYGLWVMLCHWCHNEPPYGVHFNAEAMDYLHREGQKAFEKNHSRKEFLEIFKRGNYL